MIIESSPLMWTFFMPLKLLSTIGEYKESERPKRNNNERKEKYVWKSYYLLQNL